MYWAQRLKITTCCLPSITDLLLGAQHPQLWLPRYGKLNHEVQGEAQDPASSTRSTPFLFLLLYKHSHSSSPVCGGVTASLWCPLDTSSARQDSSGISGASCTCWRSKSTGAQGIALGSSCAQQVSLEADKWRSPNTSNQSAEAQNC